MVQAMVDFELSSEHSHMSLSFVPVKLFVCMRVVLESFTYAFG